jgi:DNA invertase Pin-like site-specific DNA recombinase
MTSNPTVDLYLRLSVDREGKDSLERQEADLRAWAAREGLTVRKVWADAGKSGYKADVVRPGFNAAVAAITSGEVGALAVWKLDRLGRRGAGQIGLLLDQVEAMGGRLVFLQDHLDSSKTEQRLYLIIKSEQAREESANTSLRVKAKIAADVAKGYPKRGTRPFGWESDGVTLRESEAALVREAVRSVLDGGSMTKIAHDWNAAGVLTDGMKRERVGRDGVKRPARQLWTTTTVRQVLLRKRNAGILVHGGEERSDSRIEPIITREELDTLTARIKAGTPVASRATSPFGGVLRCACGQPMHFTTSYSQRKGGPRHVYNIYKCAATLYDKTRSHASVTAAKAEKVAVSATVSALIHKRNADPTPDEGAMLRARHAELEAERASATDDLSIPGVDKARIRTRLAQIDADARQVAEALERHAVATAGASIIARANELAVKFARADFDSGLTSGVDRRDLAEAWGPLREEVAALPPEELRAFARAMVDIRVNPRGAAERFTVTYPGSHEPVPVLWEEA